MTTHRLLGPLQRVTAPSGLAVSLDEVKSHLKIEHTAEDSLLTALVTAAQEFVETEIPGHRQLLTATYDLPVADWWDGCLPLPRPPLASVGSVKYYDTGGTLQTLSTSVYQVRTAWRAPGTIERAPGQSFPAFQSDRNYPITVRFTCGYGIGTSVPAKLRQAVLLVVAHWYLNREPIGSVTGQIALTVDALARSEGYGSYA